MAEADTLRKEAWQQHPVSRQLFEALAGVALAGLGEYGFGLFARPVLPQSMGSAILRAAPESAISQSRGCELAVNLLLACCELAVSLLLICCLLAVRLL